MLVQIVLCSFRVLENTGHRCIVGVSSHQLTVGTLTQHMQGYSGRGVARVNAIESRQDILDGQMSSVLAKVDANTETLSELKTLLHRFMGSVKVADIGSPSESKSVVEQCSGAQVRNVEGLDALLSGRQENYIPITLQNEVQSGDLVDTPPDPIWSAAKTLLSISSPEHRGGGENCSGHPNVVSPTNDRSSKKEGQQELEVDPYTLPKSPDTLPKSQSVAKEVTPLPTLYLQLLSSRFVVVITNIVVTFELYCSLFISMTKVSLK
jgi:hypothetical protein